MCSPSAPYFSPCYRRRPCAGGCRCALHHAAYTNASTVCSTPPFQPIPATCETQLMRYHALIPAATWGVPLGALPVFVRIPLLVHARSVPFWVNCVTCDAAQIVSHAPQFPPPATNATSAKYPRVGDAVSTGDFARWLARNGAGVAPMDAEADCLEPSVMMSDAFRGALVGNVTSSGSPCGYSRPKTPPFGNWHRLKVVRVSSQASFRTPRRPQQLCLVLRCAVGPWRLSPWWSCGR